VTDTFLREGGKTLARFPSEFCHGGALFVSGAKFGGLMPSLANSGLCLAYAVLHCSTTRLRVLLLGV